MKPKSKPKLNLSEDQTRALEHLLTWAKKPGTPALTLGGYAGTGKTTLISILRTELRKAHPGMKIAFAAFTGKASQVLRGYLESHNALYPEDTCGTIHSLLYTPEVDKEGKIKFWKRSKVIDADLIVIDEASMVTENIWQDLLACEKPIIALGDHGQLPPISGSFNLMEKPHILLERIHRQAESNPIIQMAHEARTTGAIRAGALANNVRKVSHSTHDPSEIDSLIDHLFSNYHNDMLVLCGRNKTRNQLNRAIRSKLGYESADPEVGEKVVCLKNNYSQVFAPIYNGMTGYIETIEPHKDHWYKATIDFPEEGRSFEGLITKQQFNSPILVESIEGVHFKEMGDRFDFGYAVTVHKAQGSQARTVVLFEERFMKSDDEAWRRWLYTAVTRARDNLYIIGA